MEEKHADRKSAHMSVLIVEMVHRMPTRPWTFLTGVLVGSPIRVGAPVTLEVDGAVPVTATIKVIEPHSPPGKVTIAIDTSKDLPIPPGSTVTVG